MKEKWYQSLLKLLKNRLLFYGFKIKKETNDVIIFDLLIEDLIIPKKRNYEDVVFYFVKDTEIVYKFYSQLIYKKNLFREFIKCFWDRQYENLNRYDNI